MKTHPRQLLLARFLSAVALLLLIPAPWARAQCIFGDESIISVAADGATSVFAADINGDDHIDVLSASYLDGKIGWYRNNGSLPPAFTAYTITTAADGAQSVFAADVNGDGNTDVLSASEIADTIAWYESDGSDPPNFTERIISLAADGAQSVFAADMDGDLDIDVLSASAMADKIHWYENDGSDPPIFTTHTIASGEDGAASVFAADVDGDGDTDVLAAIRREDKIVWYENDGASDPIFSARTIATGVSRPRLVIGADVDGDGDTDAVCASYADDTIAWYESDGALPPAWTAHTITTTADGAFSVAAADMDGDGDTDVLSASDQDDKIAWYENDGVVPPAFTTHIITTDADGANEVFAADMDGDGDPDVLSASNLDDKVAWYRNGPDTCVEPPTLEVPAALPTARYSAALPRSSAGLPSTPATRMAGDFTRNHRSSGSTACNGLYLFSGELRLAEVDLRIPGRGFDFILARTYRSRTSLPSALGTEWDFSYDVRVESAGADTIIHDGNGRADLYQLQLDGTWATDGFFRVLSLDVPSNTFTLTFEDTSRWRFLPLTDPTAPGKIDTIVDRNGNTMSFGYDPSGRLVTVDDTLFSGTSPRQITLAYNLDGFLELVTDWAGRTVSYDYYQNGDPDGSFGDLKSVTTPVVGDDAFFALPPGHEFPSGKTTTYTYSTGFADANLNHNLLTITDPLGQAYLVNEYALTTDPLDLDYDRVVRQTWGDPGDQIDLAYVSVVPDIGNQFAVIQAIVNDRVGHVEEHFFDARNLRVMLREFTGTADPDLPTTITTNRPIGKLRATDPDVFETRWEYNDDFLPTVVTFPAGNQRRYVYELELDPLAPRRLRGNLRELHQLPGTHPVPGDQASIVEFFEYEPGFGAPAAGDFVTVWTDAKGVDTLSTYDGAGNLTSKTHRIPSIVDDFQYNAFGQLTQHTLPDNGSGHRREDVFTYYGPSDGFLNGYPRDVVVDAAVLPLTATRFYDSVGHVTRVVDRRGNDVLSVVNQLGQTVHSETREVTLGGGLRYTRDFFYDANDNLVRVDVQNVDDQGVVQLNDSFTTTYEHGVLNRITRVIQEVDAVDSVVTEYAFDENRNRTLVRLPAAVDGSQPDNAISFAYDERDLLYQSTRGSGGPDAATFQVDYDANRNLEFRRQGLEATPRVTGFVHDAYDRFVSTTDPMGNVGTLHYDPNHNVESERTDGQLTDVPGSSGNLRLQETEFVHDAMDRLTRRDVHFFNTATQGDLQGGTQLGKSRTSYAWTDASGLLSITNDNGHVTFFEYDTANRRSVVTDSAANTLTFSHDANSNVTRVTSVEKSDIGAPDQVFMTDYDHDGLDRLILVVDSAGNTRNSAHDSRGHLTLATDALGNEIRYDYDGLGRLIRSTAQITDDGTGSGSVTGSRVTEQGWDPSSRRVSVMDDNGNVTQHFYDGLDRMTATLGADGTAVATTFNVFDDIVAFATANDALVGYTYDANGRPTNKSIAPGELLSGDTTFASFVYDGVGNLKSAVNDQAAVEFEHDSLLHVVRETVNRQSTIASHDGLGNVTSTTYPGGRVITRTYDVLDRLKTVTDDTGVPQLVSSCDYVGPSRLTRRDLGNNTRLSISFDGIVGVPNPPGDFGVRRVIATNHVRDPAGSNTPIDQRTYRWDARGRKTERDDVRPGGPQLDHEYTYDSLHQLVLTHVVRVRDTDYELDDVGNRVRVDGADYRMFAGLPEPADAQMDQYSRTPFDRRRYDDSGNLVDVRPLPGSQRPGPGGAIPGGGGGAGSGLGGGGGGGSTVGLAAEHHSPPGKVIYRHDYRNRLVKVEKAGNPDAISYVYDPMNRRIAKVIDLGGSTETTRYLYYGNRLVEEQDGANVTLATYVQGLGPADQLNMQRAGNDFYYHGDDMLNVMAVTDASGAVVERYEYGDYGERLVFTGAGSEIQETAIGNSWGFKGRLHDGETGSILHGSRYLDPRAGRFTTRGPGGSQHGYAGNNPWSPTPIAGIAIKEEGVNFHGGGGGPGPMGIAIKEEGVNRHGGGIDPRKAEDLISSRNPLGPGGDVGGLTLTMDPNGGLPDPQKAEDLNSSRSNVTLCCLGTCSTCSPTKRVDGGGLGGGGPAPVTQTEDLNSGRSNVRFRVNGGGLGGDGDDPPPAGKICWGCFPWRKLEPMDPGPMELLEVEDVPIDWSLVDPP